MTSTHQLASSMISSSSSTFLAPSNFNLRFIFSFPLNFLFAADKIYKEEDESKFILPETSYTFFYFFQQIFFSLYVCVILCVFNPLLLLNWNSDENDFEVNVGCCCLDIEQCICLRLYNVVMVSLVFSRFYGLVYAL